MYPDGNHVSRIGGGIGPLAQLVPDRAGRLLRDRAQRPDASSAASSPSTTSRSPVAFARAPPSGRIRDDVTAPTEPKLSCTTGDQSWVAVRDGLA